MNVTDSLKLGYLSAKVHGVNLENYSVNGVTVSIDVAHCLLLILLSFFNLFTVKYLCSALTVSGQVFLQCCATKVILSYMNGFSIISSQRVLRAGQEVVLVLAFKAYYMITQEMSGNVTLVDKELCSNLSGAARNVQICHAHLPL